MRIVLLPFVVLLTVVLPALNDRDHQHEIFDGTKMFSEERYSSTFAVEVLGDEELAKDIAEKYSFQYRGTVCAFLFILRNTL